MRIWLACLLCGLVSLLTAQSTMVQLRVESASASTTCTTGGSANPFWGINIENEGWQYFGNTGNCAPSFPLIAWERTFGCGDALPTEVEICFEVFDNASADCVLLASCTETTCNTFTLPAANDNNNSSLAVGGVSSGTVNFSLVVETVPPPANDLPCGAIDLGTLGFGTTLGDLNQGIYNNRCATNTDDLQPTDQSAYLFNESGVWFTFETGPDIARQFSVEAASDPENTGDPLDLELLVFRSLDGSCTIDQLVYEPNIRYDLSGNDGNLQLYCTEPNTRYYIIIDGTPSPAENLQGTFGLQVTDIGVREGGDNRCDFEDLGQVPTDGAVSTNGLRSNFCATSLSDPFVRGFSSRQSVWFSFRAPESGHVRIDALSGPAPDGVDIEMAIYFSRNDACTGSYRFMESTYSDATFDEQLELNCLDPGRPYFILIDGSARTPPGTFSITVTDAGDTRPRVAVDTTLCAGSTYQVGAQIYTESGIYIDTLQTPDGCDSIVTSTLTVLEPLQLIVVQTDPALGETGTNGRAEATVSGGLAPYTIEWCDGFQGATNGMLLAGSTCCVTVTDAVGCQRDTCITVDFVRPILPIWSDGQLACFGDTNGVIAFSATGGEPPLSYGWATATGQVLGTGSIPVEGQAIEIPALAAGSYQVTVFDDFFDTTFTVQIQQPPVLSSQIEQVTDASCFGDCNGAITVSAVGGTGALSYEWSDDTTESNRANLCAGTYGLTVTDANGCRDSLEQIIDQPEPFVVTPLIEQQVSCNGGSDGRVVLITTGAPTNFAWSNGAEDAVVSNLAAGLYTVTVTNIDRCQSTANIVITEPAIPLTALVDPGRPISCADSQDGSLSVVVIGEYQELFYNWSTGSDRELIDSLGPGVYQLEVTNEKGCTAAASYELNAPEPLSAELIRQDLDCISGPNAGTVEVLNSSGGIPPYQYRLGGQVFSTEAIFTGLGADTYTFELEDSLGCVYAQEVSILPPPDITLSLGLDQEIRLGDSVEIVATTNAAQPLFFWEGLDSLEGGRHWLRPLESQNFRVVVEDAVTACTANARVRVIVDKAPRVFLPNAFSPNGDGRNDTFLPFGGPDVLRFNNFRLFARNGQLLYERVELLPNQLEAGWDGVISGEPANAGVYLFTVEVEFIDGRTAQYTGDVVLMR